MNVFAVIALTFILLDPPPPAPDPFKPPAQALPWPLVTFPTVAAPDTLGTIEWGAPTNSEEYADQEPEIITTLDNWLTPIEDMASGIDDLINMDDAPTYDVTGNVDTGLTATGGGALTTDSMFATLGTSIGSIFGWVRLLVGVSYLSSGSLILILLQTAVNALGLMIGLKLLILLIKFILLLLKIANPILTILLALIKRF